jgi:hypothetical protein
MDAKKFIVNILEYSESITVIELEYDAYFNGISKDELADALDQLEEENFLYFDGKYLKLKQGEEE